MQEILLMVKLTITKKETELPDEEAVRIAMADMLESKYSGVSVSVQKVEFLSPNPTASLAKAIQDHPIAKANKESWNSIPKRRKR